MRTPHRPLRLLTGAALVAALLMPVLRARAVTADQFADATAPVDDPRTPGPDLYAGRDYGLVPDMPDPVTMDVVVAPTPLPEPAPAAFPRLPVPARAVERPRGAATARGPPAS